MRKPTYGAGVVVALLMSLPPPARAAAKPKLVVMLAIDQMRADYVDTYGKSWKGGLARLFEQGAHFRNAAYPYLQTVTCAGHATLSTGAYPYAHGMVQNAWYDRVSKKNIACTDDAASPIVSYGSAVAGGDSAHLLLVPTLGDEMRAQLWPPPRIVTFSLKARSAIMLAGHAGASVVWTDGGALVTSKAFSSVPVPAIGNHLTKFPIAWDKLAAWTRLLSPGAYAFDDDAVAEATPPGWSRTFPHALVGRTPLETMSNWARSPLSDEYLAQMALETVRTMKLGQGASTDYLGVSFSVLDLVGHAFGPRSHEVQDVLARLDQTLGKLLMGLDSVVGKNNYVVALSSDHGVAPLPEQMTALGLGAGRISTSRLRSELEGAVAREVGGANNVSAIVYTDIYLAPGVYDKLQAKPGALDRVLAACKRVAGIAHAFSAGQLRQPRPSDGDAQYAAALSFHPERSGDLVVSPSPLWIVSDAGTTHGSANDYDQRVPIVFMGAGIKAAKHHRRVSPADIAPTLAEMLGITLSKADGHTLAEALPGR